MKTESEKQSYEAIVRYIKELSEAKGEIVTDKEAREGAGNLIQFSKIIMKIKERLQKEIN